MNASNDPKRAARAAFDAAELAEQEASRRYHATVPREEKTQERYAEYMRPFWEASQAAYEEYKRLGGRLGA